MAQPANLPFRFRLSTMLLLVAIVALSISLVMTQRRLSQLESEAASQRPLSVEEVARQFEKNASVGPVTVKVTDARYSPKVDSYRVNFSWTDPKTKVNWESQVNLAQDGFGKYFGTISSDQFIQAVGYQGGFTVVVETPSAFKR
jgi:hypothetical protein